jgi:hypothetical protein
MSSNAPANALPKDTIYTCSFEPPHRLKVESQSATPRGVVLRLSDADNPGIPPREIFVTRAELKMGYENVYKACFLCVDRGRKEKAFAIPKSDLE